MIGVHWIDAAFEILGIVVLAAWLILCIVFWRAGRAAETTRPAASLGRGQRLGLVANPSQPGAGQRHSPGTPHNPAGKQSP